MASRDSAATRLASTAAQLRDLLSERRSFRSANISTFGDRHKTGRVAERVKKFEGKGALVERQRTPPLALPESSDETPNGSGLLSSSSPATRLPSAESQDNKKKHFARHLTSTRILHNIFGKDSEKKKGDDFKEKKDTVMAISGAALKEPLLIREARPLKKAESARDPLRDAADFEALRRASAVKKRVSETSNGATAELYASVRRKSKRLSTDSALPSFLRPKSMMETKEKEFPREELPRQIIEVAEKPIVRKKRKEKGEEETTWATRRPPLRTPSKREPRLPPPPPSIVVVPPPGRPLSRTLTSVEERSLPPLYEGSLDETRSTAATEGRRPRRYVGGSHTTSTILEGRDSAPDAAPRRHLIGFLHRTSHLSLTSELSADASFYLIGHRGRRVEDSTIGSESDARMFSDDDDRGSTTTDITSVSRQHENIYRRRRNRRKYRQPSRASSFSSITESSMSLDVISVTLNMDTVNFLGISIVGQSSARGDNGIYVANIMKGGAVALDGRIEAGDMILQVNDISFENFTNDQAVDVLRDAVARKGPIKLTVAKCFENGPRSCFAVPRHGDEPVRPIDPHAWIQHTNAMRGMPSILEGSEGAPTPLPGEFTHGRPPSSSTVTSGSGGAPNTVVGGHLRFDVNTDKKKIVEAMMMPNSGLDIKNRTWLKIPIPMSFLGSDLVDWLLEHVDGLRERRDARRFASDLLKAKLIAHVVNKLTFTEKCYYVTTLPDAARLRGMAETAAQAEPIAGWRYQSNQNAPSMASGYASLPVSPFPFATQQHGYGGGQSTASQLPYPPAPPAVLPRPGADLHSQASGGSSSGSENRHNRAVLPRASAVGAAGSQLELPQELAASRQSFRLAMNQPLAMNVQQQPFEFFIDNI